MPEVRIVQLAPEVLHALAAGELSTARERSGLDLPEALVDPGFRSTWQLRSEQVVEDPDSARWITGAVLDTTTGAVVGQAGFHGPPDATGMVEVGYKVLPELRRRGYGRAMLTALLQRAAEEPAVRVVRASISPTNVASLAVIAPFAFVQVGEQEDEEDGLELILELAESAAAP